MAVNAKFPLLAMRQAESLMRDGGRIVNISTLNTLVPGPGIALYCASKAALEQFTKVAAREFGPRGITVNTVSPGATDTELLHADNAPAALERTTAFTALGRLGQPADIADVVAFLAGRTRAGSPARTSRQPAACSSDPVGPGHRRAPRIRVLPGPGRVCGPDGHGRPRGERRAGWTRSSAGSWRRIASCSRVTSRVGSMPSSPASLLASRW